MKQTLIRDLNKPTISRYLAEVERVEDGEWCGHTIYRGHAKERWRVAPELLRKPDPKDPDTYKKLEGLLATLREDRMFDEFCRHLFAFRPDLVRASRSPNASPLEWRIMALARHYGLPTRFIDFTTNSLVALFFAVEEEPKENAIVCLVRVGNRRNVSDIGRVAVGREQADISPIDLSYLMLWHLRDRIEGKPDWDKVKPKCEEVRCKYPDAMEQPSQKRLAEVAFLPEHVDGRIPAQGSLFMYELSFKKQRLEEALEERKAIRGIRIQAADKGPLRRQLNALGVK